MKSFSKKIMIISAVLVIGMAGYFLYKKMYGAGMSSNDCVFCKIIAHEFPRTVVAESDDVIAIKDINPKAPVHYLIMPKKHIQDIQSFTAEDMPLSQSMIKLA